MRREAWMRAMDVQMDTFKWGMAESGVKYNTFFLQDVLERVTSDDPSVDNRLLKDMTAELWQAFQGVLWKGDTLFVTSDMLHLLMEAASSLPEDAIFDEKILITEHAFCLFEEPLVGVDRHDRHILFHGMCWTTRVTTNPNTGIKEKYLMMFFLVDPNDPEDSYNQFFVEALRKHGLAVPPLTLQHFWWTPFNKQIGPERTDVQGSKIVHETLKLFIAMQLMGQQKVGEPMHLHPDRATRKRIQREWEDGDRLITLITLRRKTVKKDKEEAGKVEWSRRWLVHGFWRRQWYPKRKVHDYVYIHDYVKGPEDKPFITSHRVFNFRR